MPRMQWKGMPVMDEIEERIIAEIEIKLRDLLTDTEYLLKRR